MTLRELIERAIEMKVDLNSEIELEVGGDGAIHRGNINSVTIYDGKLKLSGEYE